MFSSQKILGSAVESYGLPSDSGWGPITIAKLLTVSLWKMEDQTGGV